LGIIILSQIRYFNPLFLCYYHYFFIRS
jgi:hypothetical protein